jgi:hypothetical protein
VSPNFSQRTDMQNQENALAGKRNGRFPSPVDAVANPKVVLMVVGLCGLFVDLFIQPISMVGLALILLAAMPWILQAWSLRSRPQAPSSSTTSARSGSGPQDAPRRPAPDQRSQTSAPRAGPNRAEQAALATAADPRRVQPSAPQAPQPCPAATPAEPQGRSDAVRSPQIRTIPPRTA